MTSGCIKTELLGTIRVPRGDAKAWGTLIAVGADKIPIYARVTGETLQIFDGESALSMFRADWDEWVDVPESIAIPMSQILNLAGLDFFEDNPREFQEKDYL